MPQRVLPNVQPDFSGLRSLLKLPSPANKSFDPAQENAEESGIAMNAAHNAFDAARMNKTWDDADQIENAQRDEVAAIRAAQVGARVRGFDDPQAEAAYGRKQEERKLELPLETAKVQAQTTIDRLLAAQGATDARTRFIQGEENGRNNARISGQVNNRIVPQQMYKDVATNRASYEGGMNKLGRMIGLNGGTSAYEQSLQSVLDRKGTLDDMGKVAGRLSSYQGDIDAKIAAAQNDPAFEYDLSGLDDIERAYLALKLGR